MNKYDELATMMLDQMDEGKLTPYEAERNLDEMKGVLSPEVYEHVHMNVLDAIEAEERKVWLDKDQDRYATCESCDGAIGFEDDFIVDEDAVHVCHECACDLYGPPVNTKPDINVNCERVQLNDLYTKLDDVYFAGELWSLSKAIAITRNPCKEIAIAPDRELCYDIYRVGEKVAKDEWFTLEPLKTRSVGKSTDVINPMARQSGKSRMYAEYYKAAVSKRYGPSQLHKDYYNLLKADKYKETVKMLLKARDED